MSLATMSRTPVGTRVARRGSARSVSPTSPRAEVLRLQRLAGNRAVGDLLRLQRDGEDSAEGAPQVPAAIEFEPDDVIDQMAAQGSDVGADDQAVDDDGGAVEDDSGESEDEDEAVDAQLQRAPTSAVVQRDDPSTPTPTKEGKPGDILKALSAVPDVKLHLDDFKTRATDLALGRGDAEATAGLYFTAAFIAAPAAIALLRDRKARGFVFDQLDGVDIPLPGVKGLTIAPAFTNGDLSGGTVKWDLTSVGLKGVEVSGGYQEGKGGGGTIGWKGEF